MHNNYQSLTAEAKPTPKACMSNKSHTTANVKRTVMKCLIPYHKHVQDHQLIYLFREVDQLLRGELEILQAALARDFANKGKKMRKASKKKGRTGRKSKKKKEKDLTPDRTLESLFEELVTNGIIRKYPEVQLTEFRGERSYAAHDLRKQGKDPLPSLGDIRQVILEYCILPIGSKTIHQTAPLVKSVLLAGPRGSGKDMLVHAVCTETGSVLFDLSPANIVGKYPGKSGLIMLVSYPIGNFFIKILLAVICTVTGS